MRLVRTLFLGTLALTGATFAVVSCVSDSNPTDAGAGDSGPADSGPPPVTFCTSIDADLCEDFDRADALPSPPQITNGFGDIALDTQVFRSPPRSAHVLLNPTVADGGFTAALERFDVPVGGANGFTLDFDWYLATVNMAPNWTLDLVIVRGDGTGGSAVHLQGVNGVTTLSAGIGFAPVPMPMLNQWTHVTVDAIWNGNVADGGSAGDLAVTVGNTATVHTPLSGPKPGSTFNALFGGVRILSPSPTVQYSVDNVVIHRR